jgi:23S rRNA G2445 N2-methylase RlmL
MDYSVKSARLLAEDALMAPDIAPENVRGEDFVTMVWELLG